MPVTLKPLLTMQGPNDGTPVDVAEHIESFKPESSREEIGFANFGDMVEKIALGRYSNKVSLTIKPKGFAILRQFLTWYREGSEVAVVFLQDKTQPKGPENPELRFAVVVSTGILPGGDGKTKIEASPTWTINTSITYDDGTALELGA